MKKIHLSITVDAEEKTPVTLQEEKDEEFFDCQVQIETSPKETTNETKKTASLPWGGKHVLDVGAGNIKKIFDIIY